MSDDMVWNKTRIIFNKFKNLLQERKQKEIDAKIFVNKINKDKYSRLIKEDEKRKQLENRLLHMTNGNGLTKLSIADKYHENKKLDFTRGVKISNSKAATPSTADREVQLPVIKNSQSYKTIEIPNGKKINLMN